MKNSAPKQIDSLHQVCGRFSATTVRGRWERRYGEILKTDELDMGYRLIVGRPLVPSRMQSKMHQCLNFRTPDLTG